MDKKHIRNSIWNSFDYLSSIILTAITTKFLISELGTEAYGFYVFFTGLIGTFGLVDIGAGMAISKYLCEYIPQKKMRDSNEIITIGLLFYLLIGFLLASVIWVTNETIISFLDFPSRYYSLGICILNLIPIILIINLITSIPINILVANERWNSITINNVVFKMINSAVLVFIVLTLPGEESLKYIFFAFLIIAVTKLLCITITAKKCFKEFELAKPSRCNIGKITKFLKASLIQYLFSLLSGHIDKFIISKIFGLSTLGVYTFCVQVFSYIYGFISNVFKVTFPTLSKLHGQQDFVQLEKYFFKYIKLILIVNVFIAITTLCLWNIVMSLYIDDNFAIQSFYYMKYFAVFLVVRSLEIILYYFFNAIAKPQFLVKNTVIGTIIIIGMYFIFIKFFGVVGIILSQIFASICVYLYNFFLYYHNKQLFWR